MPGAEAEYTWRLWSVCGGWFRGEGLFFVPWGGVMGILSSCTCGGWWRLAELWELWWWSAAGLVGGLGFHRLEGGGGGASFG